MSSSELLNIRPTRERKTKIFGGAKVDVEILQTIAIVFDAIFLIFTGLLADWVVVGHGIWWGDSASLGAMSVVLFVAVYAFRGGYVLESLASPQAQIKQLAIAWASVFFILAWSAFLFKVSASFSRLGVTFFFSFGGLGLLFLHMGGALALRSRLAKGKLCLQRVFAVFVGESGEFDKVRSMLPRQGKMVVGYHLVPMTIKSMPRECLQLTEKLRCTLGATGCDEVLLFASWSNQRQIAELLEVVKLFPTPAVLVADRAVNHIVMQRPVTVGPLHGFEVQRAPLSRTDRVIKRLFDITVATVALILLALPMAITSIAILIESGRPVLFRQHRKGFGGRVFEILKFRTMTVQENGPQITQAGRRDKRVTRLGRILRRSSIDELPQFLNVLRGDMSIIGPRPHALAHDNQYDDQIATYAFRHHVKPGITGWAQINGYRGETRELRDMEARVEHDLWYINHWSIWLDFRIMFQTAAAVLFDKNAY